MTYEFDVDDYGVHGHLFKIVDIDINKEIQKIKNNPKGILSVQQYPVDHQAMLMVICYKNKPNEIIFFKSARFGREKYTEIRRALGIRV